MNLLEIRNLSMAYKNGGDGILVKQSTNKVLYDISLNINEGEVLGLVGESGCGKSTLGKCILSLEPPKSVLGGQILFEGKDISKYNKNETKEYRKKAQLIFQNPYSSLNPRMSIYETLKEPLEIHKMCTNKKEYDDKIEDMLNLVGLKKEDKQKFPHEFSGGQRQRIAIARALIISPKFIVADEPVSALDVSIQAQIINLLSDLKEKFNLTILFISHDLNIVRYLSDNIAIMNKGKIIETGSGEDIFKNPKEEYTKTLLNAVLKVN